MTWELVGNVRGTQGPPGNLDRGQIPLGANLNTFYGAASVGSYGVPLQSIVDGLVNAPAGAKPGTFTVFPVGSTASTQIWTEYLAPGRMFVSGVSTSGRTAPWRDLTAADDGGNFLLSGFATFDAINKTSNYSLWSGPQATAAGAPVGQVGEIRTYIIGTAGIQTFTTANPTIGTQVFVRGKGSQGWGEFREVTNQPGIATGTGAAKAGFKNAYLALNQPATGGTETVSADAVRWPFLNSVGSKRARLHVRNWNWATGTAFGAAAFTGAWMGPAAGKDFTAAPTKVLPAFNLPSNGSEYVSPWFAYDATADTQHLLSVGYTTTAGQANQSSRGGAYRSGNPADAALATGFPGVTSTTSPFDVWLELEVPASTPIVAGFGDSNVVGAGATLPVYDSWLNKYARATKSLPYFASIHGSTTDTWKTASKTMWNRIPDVARPDAVINFLGQNDLVEGVTLATMQANFNTILPILRDKLTPEIYAATITPADAKSTAVNTVRKAYNTWLKTLPGGVKDVFDFSATISDDDLTIRPSDNADGVHFLTSGHTKLAAAVTARPVTPPSIQKGDPGVDGIGMPTGGAALQFIRKNSAGNGTEWITPTRDTVGLGNVNNTADLDKPISAPQQEALVLKLDASKLGAASGAASLGPDTKLVEAQIPSRMAQATLDASYAPINATTWLARQKAAGHQTAKLADWKTALANRNTAAAQAIVIGDSISEGSDAGTVQSRWLNVLQAMLRYKLSVSGGAEFPFIPAMEATSATGMPCVTEGSVGLDQSWGLGWRTAILNDDTSKITFTFTGTSAAIMYAKQGSTGVLRIVVDGGTAVLVDSNTLISGGTSDAALWNTGPLTAGVHTVVITRDVSSGSGQKPYIEGLLTWNGDETKGVRFVDSSHSGYRSADISTTRARTTANAIKVAGNASLAIIAMGTNDTLYPADLPNYQANIQRMIDALRTTGGFTGSILLVHWYLWAAVTPEQWKPYGDYMNAIAAADPKVAYLDMTQHMPPLPSPYTAPVGLGLYAGNVHPNAAGHEWIAQTLASVLNI